MHRHRIDLDELARVVGECGGEDTGIVLDEQQLDTPFHELGQDSLAVLQVIGRLGRRYGVRVPEELLLDADTPRLLLEIFDRCASDRSA